MNTGITFKCYLVTWPWASPGWGDTAGLAQRSICDLWLTWSRPMIDWWRNPVTRGEEAAIIGERDIMGTGASGHMCTMASTAAPRHCINLQSAVLQHAELAQPAGMRVGKMRRNENLLIANRWIRKWYSCTNCTFLANKNVKMSVEHAGGCVY